MKVYHRRKLIRDYRDIWRKWREFIEHKKTVTIRDDEMREELDAKIQRLTEITELINVHNEVSSFNNIIKTIYFY